MVFCLDLSRNERLLGTFQTKRLYSITRPLDSYRWFGLILGRHWCILWSEFSDSEVSELRFTHVDDAVLKLLRLNGLVRILAVIQSEFGSLNPR